MTILATRPNTLEAIRAGEIYEMNLFTAEEIAALRKTWRMQQGTIADRGAHKGVTVVRFIARRQEESCNR